MKKRTSNNFIKRGAVHKGAALALLSALLLSVSSCGTREAAAAPELLTPVALTDSYRPVERRDIGEVSYLNGTVVPESYPVFSKDTIFIYQLKVNPGDQVKKGDVIAVGDTREAEKEISACSKQLEVLRQKRASGEIISKKTEEKLGYRKKAAEEAGFTEEAAAYDMAIRKEQENRRYTLAQDDAAIAELEKQISKLRQERAKLTFTAPHDGQVTYLVDIASTSGSMVMANANIAVISDFSDLYIESDALTNDYKYADYQEKYIMSDGKKYPVEEYAYTQAELSYAKNVNRYPRVRFRAKGLTQEAGSVVPIYFTKNSCTDVLAVGNDSVYQEGEVYYCYVQDSEGQRERRELELGVRDSLYSEVKSGLSEGEQVLYDNKAVMPAKYKEYQVKPGVYTEEAETEYYGLLETEHTIRLAETTGSVQEVKVSAGAAVTKGQELLTIAVPSGKGEQAEQKNTITDIEQGHKASLAEFDEREKAAKAAIEAAKKAGKIPVPVPKSDGNKEEKEQAGTASDGNDGNEEVKERAGTASDGNDGNKEIKEQTETATDGKEQEKEQTGTASGGAEGNDAQTGGEDGVTDEEKQAYLEGRYAEEENRLELEILAEERKMEAVEYNAGLAEVKAALAESSAGSGGTVSIKAESSGTIGQNIPTKDISVVAGQYLYTISSPGEKLLKVNMPVKRGKMESGPALPGQKLVISTEGKDYAGVCVAESAGSRVCLFTRDGEAHLTTYPEGEGGQFIVKTDDDGFFAGEELPKGKVHFDGVSVKGGIVVPAKCVYTEQDPLTQQTTSFVWRVTENGLSKQNVTVFPVGQYSDDRLILAGLSVGDVIAEE